MKYMECFSNLCNTSSFARPLGQPYSAPSSSVLVIHLLCVGRRLQVSDKSQDRGATIEYLWTDLSPLGGSLNEHSLSSIQDILLSFQVIFHDATQEAGKDAETVWIWPLISILGTTGIPTDPVANLHQLRTRHYSSGVLLKFNIQSDQAHRHHIKITLASRSTRIRKRILN